MNCLTVLLIFFLCKKLANDFAAVIASGTPESEKYIFVWFGGFLRNGYTLVGVVDKNTPDVTVYKWYDDAKNYTIPPPPVVLILSEYRMGTK